jgi:hypothetical protein
LRYGQLGRPAVKPADRHGAGASCPGSDAASGQSTDRSEATQAWPAVDPSGDEARIADAAGLLRDHPRWAVWLPASDGNWTGIRPASSRPPAPELPMVWVRARTPDELARLMRAADEQVAGGGWFGGPVASG